MDEFRYDYLETIDTSIGHLLETLKQYGINATTYEQARQQYAKQYPKPVEPVKPLDPIKELELEIEKEVVQEIEKGVLTDEAEERMVKKYPNKEKYIRWQFKKKTEARQGRKW